MSYTEIYAFGKDGNAYLLGMVKNSWGGAVAVWNKLEKKYLSPWIPDYVKATCWYSPGMSYDEIISFLGYTPTRLTSDLLMQEIWDLGQNPNVDMTDRIVLYTTYDDALVKRENIRKVIDAFAAFDGSTNLQQQASILESALKDDNIIAVGWNQTSVCADNWANYGGVDENDDDIPYNCLTGDRHFWIFDELEV